MPATDRHQLSATDRADLVRHIDAERGRATALLASARRRIDELVGATNRLDRGWQGTCRRCGRAVGTDRLLARPATEHHVGCARTRGMESR